MDLFNLLKPKKTLFLIFLVLSSFICISTIQATAVYFTEHGPVTKEVLKFIRSSVQYLFVSALDVSHPEITNELLKLKKQGVDVRVISEKPVFNLPSKIDFSKGLHHVKFMVNEHGVIFGSANFSMSGLETGLNDLVFFPQSYSARFRDFFLNLWNNGTVIKVNDFLVSPIDKVEENVVKLLLKARRRIWVCVYAFSDINILAVLKYKASNGVDVRIITDKWFNTSRLSSVPLESAKIVSSKMLHHKFILVDNILLTGSTNYTESGFHRNIEMIWITKDRNIVSNYEAIFKMLYYGKW